MARKTDIRLRRSAVSGSVPGGADLNLGELALNTADGAIFVKNGAGDIVTVSHDGILHYDEPNSRIGIGTKSPSYSLDINAGTSDWPARFYSTDNKAGIIIADDDTTAYFGAENARAWMGLQPGTHVNNLNINDSGNVGIGTNTLTNGKLNIASANNTTAVSIAVGSFAAYDFTANSTSGYTTTFNMNNAGLKIGHNSSARSLALRTDSTDRLTIYGNGDIDIANNLTINGANLDIADNIRHIGDTDTYFGFHGNDLWRVVTGGVERFEVSNTGIIINDGGNDYDFRVESDTLDHALFVRGSDGHVGIGESSPDYPLHVKAASNDLLLVENSSSSGTATIRFKPNANRTASAFIKATQRGSASDDTDIQIGDEDGTIATFGEGKVGVGLTSPEATLHVNGAIVSEGGSFTSGVESITDGSLVIQKGHAIYSDDNNYLRKIIHHAATNHLEIGQNNTALIGDINLRPGSSGNIRFFTSGSANEDVTFAVNGYVGIGDTTPDEKLSVYGAVTSSYQAANFSAGPYRANMDIIDSTKKVRFGSIQGANTPTGDQGEIGFYVNSGEKVTIKTDGDVGIGTSTPAQRLEVSAASSTVVARFTRGDAAGNSTVEFAHTGGVQNTLGYNSGTGSFEIVSGTGAGSKRLAIKNSDGKITFNDAYTFPTTIGSSGQILKVPVSGTELVWANETGGSASVLIDSDGDTSVTVEANADEDIIRFNVAGSEIGQVTVDGIVLNNGYNFEGDVIGAMSFKAQAGEALTIGDVVYISGISGNTVIVSKADADDANKMPAFGLAGSTVSLNAAVEIVTFGSLLGLDTSTPSWSLGDELYVSTTAGTLTNSPPTGSSSQIQKIGKVTRVDASAGSIKIMGAGRTNATPNLDEGKIFVGNSSNQSVQVDDTIKIDMANSLVDISGRLDVASDLRLRGEGSTLDAGVARLYVDASNQLTIDAGNTGSNQVIINADGDISATDLTLSGNLTVNGTTTTLNTATLTVDDLNITVADGAANAAAADGGGLTVDGANATWNYSSADDAWKSNKHILAYTGGGTGSFAVGRDANQAIQIDVSDNYNKITAHQDADENGDHFFDLIRDFDGTGKADFRIMNTTSVHMLVDKNGNVGIGSAAPDEKLVVRGGNYASNQNGGIAIQAGDEASNHWKSAFKIKSNATGNPRTVIEATTGATAGQTNDAIQINTSGEVGFLNNIGVNIGGNPGHRIHVQESGANAAAFYMTDGTSWMRLVPNLGTSGYNSLSTAGDIGLIFSTDGDNTTDNGTTGLVIAPHSQNEAKGIKIMENGQVGIGTASPARKLHIVGSGGTQAVKVEASDASQASLDLQNSNSWFRLVAQSGELFVYDQADTAERFRIDTDGNVGIGTNNPVQKLQVDGSIYSNGGEFFVNNNKGISAVGDLILKTNDGTNYNTTMHLDGADRFVGIGTTTPAGNLHIKSIDNIGDANLIIEADADNNVESDNPRLELRQDNNLVSGALYLEGNASQTANGTFANSLVIDSKASSTAGSHAIHFVTGGLAANQTGGPTNGSVKMTIDSAGLVGIGLNNPSAGLHVKRSGFPQLKLEDDDDSMQIGFSGDVFYLKRNDNDSDIRFRRTDNTDPFVFNMAGKFFEIQGGTGVASSGTAVIRQKGDTSSDGIAITSSNATSHRIWKGSDGALNIGSSTVPNAFTQLINGDLGLGTTSPDTKLDITTSGVEGLIMNQDTSTASVSSRLFFKDSTRTNLIMNVNGLLEFRTDAGIGSTSGTRRLFISPTLVETSVPIKIEEYQINTTETSTSATTQVAIHTLSAADFRSARYTVQVTNSTDSSYHTTEVLMVHDGTTANITEFGEVHTGASVEATFDADINSGNVRLLATPASTDSMEFKVVCHSLTV